MKEKTIDIEGDKYILKRWNWIECARIITGAGNSPESFFINVIRYGLKNPKLSKEEIENLSSDVAVVLFNEILELNNIEKLMTAMNKLGRQIGVTPQSKLQYLT